MEELRRRINKATLACKDAGLPNTTFVIPKGAKTANDIQIRMEGTESQIALARDILLKTKAPKKEQFLRDLFEASAIKETAAASRLRLLLLICHKEVEVFLGVLVDLAKHPEPWMSPDVLRAISTAATNNHITPRK